MMNIKRLHFLFFITVVIFVVDQVNSFYFEGEEVVMEDSDYRFCYMKNCTTAVQLRDEAARYYNPYSSQGQGVSNFYCRVFSCSSGGSSVPFVSPTRYYRRKRTLLQQEYQYQNQPTCTSDVVPQDEYGPCCDEYTVQEDESMCDIADFFELDCERLKNTNNQTYVKPNQIIQLC